MTTMANGDTDMMDPESTTAQPSVITEPSTSDEIFVFFTLMATAFVIFCICRNGLKPRSHVEENKLQDETDAFELSELRLREDEENGGGITQPDGTERGTFYKISISDDDEEEGSENGLQNGIAQADLELT